MFGAGVPAHLAGWRLRPMVGQGHDRYPAEVDQGSSPLAAGTRVPPPSRRSRRAVIIFAVLGVTLALGSGGVYVYRDQGGLGDATAAPATGLASPEDAVRTFLSAVFLAKDPSRLSGVICASWDDQENAIERSRGEVPPDASVSWDEVRVINKELDKANVSARLRLRMPDESQPSTFVQWRFSVVDEAGWKVCEARPLVP
jgi:hypothetical protein